MSDSVRNICECKEDALVHICIRICMTIKERRKILTVKGGETANSTIKHGGFLATRVGEFLDSID